MTRRDVKEKRRLAKRPPSKPSGTTSTSIYVADLETLTRMADANGSFISGMLSIIIAEAAEKRGMYEPE